MVETICPNCQHGNPLQNRFCGQCGASLTSNPVAPREETGLMIGRRMLPAQQLKQIGQTVAVSLVALAAEAGLAWLRRRLDQPDTALTPTIRSSPPAPEQERQQRTRLPVPAPATEDVVTGFSQRVVEVWQSGSLIRQTVERTVWWRRR
jgi:hypothetical protein